MSTDSHSRNSRKVVIDLTLMPGSAIVIEAAVKLANAINAQIVGLYVENQEFIDLSGLPFTQVFNQGSREARPLSANDMNFALRYDKRVKKNTLSTQAEKARVKWSFSSERGNPKIVRDATLSSNDFLVLLGHSGSQTQQGIVNELRTLRSDIYGVMVSMEQETLGNPPGIQQSSQRDEGPIVIVDNGYQGNGSSYNKSGFFSNAISLAGQIAHTAVLNRLGRGQHLVILTPHHADDPALLAFCAPLLSAGHRVSFHQFPVSDFQLLASALRRIEGMLLITGLEFLLSADDSQLMRLLRSAKAPAILLRNQ